MDKDLPIVEGVPWYAVPWRTFVAGNRKLWEAGRLVLIVPFEAFLVVVLTFLVAGAPSDTGPTDCTK